MTGSAGAAAAGFERGVDQHLGDGFSGVVSLADGAEVIAWRAVGQANRAESIPNGLHTRLQVASGSKLFTGVAVCQLVEAGRIELDTRLHDCVPSGLLGGIDERVTIRHLLSHTSGVTSYFEEDVDPDYAALWTDTPVYRMLHPRDYLPMFVHKPKKFPPGERFEYCDAGFVLLGLVVEEVTGAAFASHVRDAVLAPAGMADSGYFRSDQLPGPAALAYLDSPGDGWRTNAFAVPVIGGGDGGAYATAPDLARLWHALVTHRLLGERMTAELLRPHAATGHRAPHDHYGLGVWLASADGYYFVEGADPGVRMISGYFPDSALSLTMLANVDTAIWKRFRALAEVCR